MTEPSTRPTRVGGATLTTRGGRTRQRILEAAAELIHEHGAAATTIQEVRGAAEVSASQLYHYFSDKQALVRAVVAYQGARLVAGQEAAEINSLQSLRRWRDQLFVHPDQILGGCPLGALGSELADTDPAGRVLAAHEFARWQASIADALKRMGEHGELRSDANTDDLAVALLAALQGGLLLSHITKSTRPLRQALDGMIAVIETNRAAAPR
jgi:TetR/AcrR family transcriptional repressor of nem operon